jgi:hypothetical protein
MEGYQSDYPDEKIFEEGKSIKSVDGKTYMIEKKGVLNDNPFSCMIIE